MPTRGMERWLTQRLSAVLGARARPPRRRLRQRRCSPPRTGWSPTRSPPPPGSTPTRTRGCPSARSGRCSTSSTRRLDEPWLAALAAYLGRRRARPPDPVRRARRLTHGPPPRRPVRPLRAAPPGDARRLGARRRHRRRRRAAAAGVAAGRRSCGGGCGARIGTPGPAERSGRACARLAEDPALVDLPARLSLFGLTRLPAGHLQVLRALAAGRDVHLFLLHPSPALWDRLARPRRRRRRWRDDRGAVTPARRRSRPREPSRTNRLLASWGRDAREMQLVLAAADGAPARPRTGRPPAAGHAARPDPGRRPGRPAPPGRAAARGAGRPPAAGRRTTTASSPRLPRPGAPGRGAPRRDPARARRRPDARAARRDRHVPGHRDLRAADPGHVRRRRDAATDGRRHRPTAAPSTATAGSRSTCGSASPTARCARPTRCSAWSPQLLELAEQRLTASQVLDLADREPGPPALPARRRRPRPAAGLDRAGRDPLGPRRRAPRAVQARGARQRNLAGRAGPAAARRDDDRGRPAAVRRRAAARRRRQRRDRPRRPLRRAGRPRSERRSTR